VLLTPPARRTPLVFHWPPKAFWFGFSNHMFAGYSLFIVCCRLHNTCSAVRMRIVYLSLIVLFEHCYRVKLNIFTFFYQNTYYLMQNRVCITLNLGCACAAGRLLRGPPVSYYSLEAVLIGFGNSSFSSTIHWVFLAVQSEIEDAFTPQGLYRRFPLVLPSSRDLFSISQLYYSTVTVLSCLTWLRYPECNRAIFCTP